MYNTTTKSSEHSINSNGYACMHISTSFCYTVFLEAVLVSILLIQFRSLSFAQNGRRRVREISACFLVDSTEGLQSLFGVSGP